MPAPNLPLRPLAARRRAAGRAARFLALAWLTVAGPSLAGGLLSVAGAGPFPGEDCAAADDSISVAVVVDFGTVEGAPRPEPVAACVSVADRANGAAALAERARVLGLPAPRFDGSGLLCAIDGFPASGCGERTAGGYRYWAYFVGDSDAWAYSSIGPGGRRMSEGSVEGWRFVEGAGNPTDPPPRSPADQEICPDAPEPTTVPPSSGTGPGTQPPPTEGGSNVGTSAGGQPAPGGQQGSVQRGAAGTPGAGGGSAGADEAATGAGGQGGGSATGGDDGTGGGDGSPSTASEGDAADPPGTAEVLTAAAGVDGSGGDGGGSGSTGRSGGGDGAPVATMAVAALAAAIAVGALVRSRRSPREDPAAEA